MENEKKTLCHNEECKGYPQPLKMGEFTITPMDGMDEIGIYHIEICEFCLKEALEELKTELKVDKLIKEERKCPRCMCFMKKINPTEWFCNGCLKSIEIITKEVIIDD